MKNLITVVGILALSGCATTHWKTLKAPKAVIHTISGWGVGLGVGEVGNPQLNVVVSNPTSEVLTAVLVCDQLLNDDNTKDLKNVVRERVKVDPKSDKMFSFMLLSQFPRYDTSYVCFLDGNAVL